MKFLFIILLFVVPLKAIAGDVALGCANESLSDFYGLIKKDYETKNATALISMLQDQVTKCGKKTQQVLGVDDQFLKSMAKESRKRELLRLKEKIDQASQFGSIQEYEKNFSELAVDQDPAFLKHFNEKKKQSQMASAYESKTCTQIDMTKDMPPVRNQDSVGWCYAFVAADLASYKLKKNISAADIALEYQDNWIDALNRSLGETPAAELSGGRAGDAVERMSEKGFCLERDLPSEDNIGGDFKATLNNIEDLGRALISADSKACEGIAFGARSIFPNANTSDIRDVLEKSSKGQFINNLREKTCKDRIKGNLKTENFWVKGIYPEGVDHLEAARSIDQQLSAKNPVALALDANAFYDRSVVSVRGKIGAHAVSIVGRRFNKASGQCEYQIRNSWGTGCSSYDTAYECKNGQFWMNKADVLKHTYGVTYVR
ncbi:C1 family peptidase [Bdellovibrio sp. HCB274]|uniref:C1 family peptidase n=1 Tax=Bdellovibrio sp. HCB274 TaxID=3394361 RepID=UPI0039B6D3AE